MSFSFVQITDHHLTGSEDTLLRGFSTWYSYRTVLRHIATHVAGQIDFIVSMGDLVDPAPDAAYRNVLVALHADPAGARVPGPLHITAEGLANVPMYFLPGNHDDLDAMLRVIFPGSPAMNRMNVTFEHSGTRFICLDWGREADARSAADTFDFLAANLADGAATVIFTHHHVAPVGVEWLDNFLAPDLERFWATVHGKNVLGILAGHVHMTTEQIVQGIPVYTLRSTAFQFAREPRSYMTLEKPHYRLVTIDKGILTSRVYEVTL